MQHSEIQWTDNTFNPWWGCKRVGPECDNCYAEKISTNGLWTPKEFVGKLWDQDSLRKISSDTYFESPKTWNRRAERTGIRERVFCGSMCDIMEEYKTYKVELADARARTFDLIEQTPYLDWQLLTKRPQNYRKLLRTEWLRNPRHNVWLMTTVGSQEGIWRIAELLKVPAVVHGVSIEPMLSPVRLPVDFLALGKSAWVITGGESGGKNIRPTPIEWFRDLRDQCDGVVPFFFKQWGSWDHENFVHISKKVAGRILDGRTWDQFPLG